jgi:hypothetical protein
MAVIGAVQSRLLTTRAALPPSKDTYRSTCARIFSTQAATVSLVFSARSAVGFGSPMRPVEPPTRISGLFPASWMRRAVTSWTRLPKCSEGAVGSKPT